MTKIDEALAALPSLAIEQQETIADFIMAVAMPVIEFGDCELGNAPDRTGVHTLARSESNS